MEIDLRSDPPTLKEIDAARAELENSRLLIMQNEVYVDSLFQKLLVKTVIITLILVIVGLLYFILPAGIFGVVNGRTILLAIISVMLISSLFWIGWKTWQEARSIIPGRGYSKEQLHQLQVKMAALTDIDVKRRLNVLNWSRMDGVLTEYMKSITRQRRHLIGLEYETIKSYMNNLSSD